MLDLPNLIDDGLHTPEVRSWAILKYRLISLYAQMFTRSMRSKYGTLVYVDLFSGSGRSRIRETGRIVAGSPLLALSTVPAFDQYVFCDSNRQNTDALTERCAKDFGQLNTIVMTGNANALVENVVKAIPAHSSSKKVLTLCVLDPYTTANLRFDTIRSISRLYVDFLMLIPTGMDMNRNKRVYAREHITTLDDFMGGQSWRDDWKIAMEDNEDFRKFIIRKHAEAMGSLGYITPEPDQNVLIRSTDKNLNLYRLVVYSRHPLGSTFWAEARKYASPQLGLDL